GKYYVSEKLVDDRNRVMLRNLFAEEDDLYGFNTSTKLFTHVAPEFVIYEDHEVTAKSASLGRIFLYLYLPKVGWLPSVQKGIASNQCKGVKYEGGSECEYTFSC
ncbi:MAG: hypothetical protein U9Q22_04830, partial [Candidatus Altiarchaeota archaeon]|nr:hypothetical protein [Candidatus Altiarchaeota archaeon]